MASAKKNNVIKLFVRGFFGHFPDVERSSDLKIDRFYRFSRFHQFSPCGDISRIRSSLRTSRTPTTEFFYYFVPTSGRCNIPHASAPSPSPTVYECDPQHHLRPHQDRAVLSRRAAHVPQLRGALEGGVL
jgi:hypothetical protein